MSRVQHHGMTLIELLIVVAIISLLLQMVLPAVEMSRESARQMHCKNNLRQLAMGAQMHVNTHGHFPTGGWTHAWVGDPNRGFNKRQPGGWCYNLLPYLDEGALHDLGRDASDPERRTLGAQMIATPVPVFTCPSRRLARAWPLRPSNKLINIEYSPQAGRSDYAANMGNLLPTDQSALGPNSLGEGDQWENGEDRRTHWVATRHNGIAFQRSEVKPVMVEDGLSKTYLFGEKFLNPEHYKTGRSQGDDQSMFIGFDRDNYRSGHTYHPPTRDKVVPRKWLASGDSPEVYDWNFGSAHPQGMNMSLCDGSVRTMLYAVDIDIHSAMSSRNGRDRRR